MSNKKGAQFKGDVTIYSGGSSDLGFGDLQIARNLILLGTTDTTSTSSGGVIAAGGVGIAKGLYVGGASNLQQTTISTNNGALSISGSNGITATVAATSSISVTTGDLTLESTNGILELFGQTSVDIQALAGGVTVQADGTSSFAVNGNFNLTHSSTLGKVILSSGRAQPDAIELNATNAAGGVSVLGGTSGFNVTMTDGPVLLSGGGIASSWSQATTGAGQHLTIQTTGATTSRLIVQSSGTTSNAFTLSATTGGIAMDSVTAYTATVTNGPMTLASTGASSSWTNTATANGHDLTISQAGAFDASLVVSSSGTGSDALQLTASASTSGIVMSSGTSGIDVSTAGPFSIDGQGGDCNVTLAATGDGQDLVLGVTGTHDTKVVLSSSGTGSNAIQLSAGNATSGITGTCGTGGISFTSTGGGFALSGSQAVCSLTQATTSSGQNFTITQTGAFTSKMILSTESTPNDAMTLSASAGGILIDGLKQVVINSADTTNGIDIGNTANVPIFLGSTTSTVTVRDNLTVVGDLLVSGTTTTVNSEVVTIADNIFLINNAPASSTDSGLLMKRFQGHNESGQGDVVSDVEAATLTAVDGTATTIELPGSASAVNNFYSGWWLRITAGTGSGQVRRIKSYNGTTKVATIYSTADETASPTVPAQGADFTTNADNTSVVKLYNTTFIGWVYKESSDCILATYASLDPSAGAPLVSTRRAKICTGDLEVMGTLEVDTILENTLNAGVTIEGVTIEDGTLTNVTSINGSTVPVDTVVNLVDNSTSGVTLPSTFAYGSYMILVAAQGNTNGAFACFMISGNATNGFYVSRLSSVDSTTGESINISASAGSPPTIFHATVKTVGATGANLPYSIKITSVVG